jgi:hypothetical protein
MQLFRRDNSSRRRGASARPSVACPDNGCGCCFCVSIAPAAAPSLSRQPKQPRVDLLPTYSHKAVMLQRCRGRGCVGPRGTGTERERIEGIFAWSVSSEHQTAQDGLTEQRHCVPAYSPAVLGASHLLPKPVGSSGYRTRPPRLLKTARTSLCLAFFREDRLPLCPLLREL